MISISRNIKIFFCNSLKTTDNKIYNATISKNRERLFGCAVDLFDIPDNFDDLDLAEDFENDTPYFI